MANSQIFDPIKFLGLKLSKEKSLQIESEFLNQMADYLAIKIIEKLPEETTKDAQSTSEILKIGQSKLNNFDLFVKNSLEDFRKEFQENLKHE